MKNSQRLFDWSASYGRWIWVFGWLVSTAFAADPLSVGQLDFLRSRCFDCHSGEKPEGGLSLDRLVASPIADELKRWEKIYDRVKLGEMPPDSKLTNEQRAPFLDALVSSLVAIDREQHRTVGRSVWRRMNRFEYENSVRDLLHAPWLRLSSILPEDGELYRFNKIGEALDVSHVNMARYMQAADVALREVIEKAIAPPNASTVRYYAREQSSFNRRVRYTVFNRSPERATFPLVGYEADLDVLRKEDQPFTVGESDPERREQEAFGVVASSYEPIEVSFNSFLAPRSGRYRLRFKGYTFWAQGEEKRWWRADREKISRGRRSEPIAIYALAQPRLLRKLGTFDFEIEPSVRELEVYLLEGETIQVDAVRLFRSRPPNFQNPLATREGMPGAAFNYLEVDGPLDRLWPSAGHRLLFDDLPLKLEGERVVVESANPKLDARRLMTRFMERAYPRAVVAADIESMLRVVDIAMSKGMSFMDAMVAGYTAVLCSPGFLCLEETPGRLDPSAQLARLSLFLWNRLPEAEFRGAIDAETMLQTTSLRELAERMLDDERSRTFVDSFLDYWLDLRRVADTSPDELLYPDYYLDDSLVDAIREETQLFFCELVRENLPVRHVVDSDFTFVNERLANHYDLEPFEGGAMRRVSLPESSPRGGLLTQASVLKVTANGTTTSPVVRGAWINERILGVKIPPPPASVPAIEPDTRGATTIRRQLELHRQDASCNGCHAKIDPPGFALESFDVLGGRRTHYRVLSETGASFEGFGKNGQPFVFRQGPAVDSSGELADGRRFSDIAEFKAQLLQDERTIAENLLEKLVVYATGASVSFSDRTEIERILDRLAPDRYRVRSMILEVVTSEMFVNK